MEENRTGYKYIYNIKLANHLMRLTHQCLGTGVSYTTNKVYWCFDTENVKSDVDDFYELEEERRLLQDRNSIVY